MKTEQYPTKYEYKSGGVQTPPKKHDIINDLMI